MTKIIWMSDPHFQTEGTIDGLDPRLRLAVAIDYVNSHYADADFAVITGDILGDEADANYFEIAAALAKCKIPIYPMMGNNDQRDGFRKHLTLPESVMPAFVQYTINTPDAQFICLDTHKPGFDAGAFCKERQDWLSRVLTDQPDKPAYVFLHHPPLALGLPPQDLIMLENADIFLDLIGRHRNVAHLFMGHVHRTTTGTVKGTPFTTLGALSFQAPPPRPAWDWDGFKAPNEAPQMAVIEIGAESVVVQFIQFCEHNVGQQ